MKKNFIYLSSLFLLLLTLVPTKVLASDISEIPTPKGFMRFVVLLPIILILVLLFRKVDMLVAGFIGGALAMVIGGISIGKANELLMTSIPAMLGITGPIINSAIATAVFKSGGYSSALALVRRGIKGRVEYFAAFIVILMAGATYMSGIGGGTAMVLAPLAFAAVGAVPEIIAAMCLAAAVSFTTSPASLESSIVSQLTKAPVGDYVTTMRFYWIIFTVIAIIIAFIGAKRNKTIFQGEESEELASLSTKELWIRTIPAIFLLFAVIAGPAINKAIGFPILGTFMYLIITIALIAVCTKFTLKESSTALIDGSHYILTRLFQVGIFITFINIITETGAFSVIVDIAKAAPMSLIVPALIIAGFAIGVPAGAYVATILALVIPIGVSLNLPLLAIGFITMAVGLGSQMSFVNITMQAQASGFNIDILDVVKGNSKWILSSLILLIILSLVVL
ncbi:citrate transporter [Streptococcus xiaochunlingii]|uniref:citrate transporter n=1 Tax=Streptococcus xiaochunlingii TaxID=2589788 RepID=UPI002555C94B|nr:citrate transporter [Streptococcus xiaochunlingii]MDK8386806.1 citrate transporter [Streptococcus xiaochunlingii]MDK8778639.1 citrate transporter [Streptococcus xiaochunlingii]